MRVSSPSTKVLVAGSVLEYNIRAGLRNIVPISSKLPLITELLQMNIILQNMQFIRHGNKSSFLLTMLAQQLHKNPRSMLPSSFFPLIRQAAYLMEFSVCCYAINEGDLHIAVLPLYVFFSLSPPLYKIKSSRLSSIRLNSAQSSDSSSVVFPHFHKKAQIPLADFFHRICHS